MITEPEAFATIKTAINALTWPMGVAIVHNNMARGTATAGYVAVTVLADSSEQRSMGTPAAVSWREGGTVTMAIHVPQGEGDARALAMAELIRVGLRGKKVGGVTFPRVRQVDQGPLPSWYFLVIEVDFYYHRHL